MSIIKRIIVEGPDLSGKDTFIDKIKSGYDKVIDKETRKIDKSKLNLNTVNEYLEKEFDLLDEYKEKSVIFNRSFLSEFVYAPIKRGYNPQNQVKKYIRKNKALLDKYFIIVIVPTLKTLTERLKIRGDDYIEEKELIKIRSRYKKLIKLLEHEKLKYMLIEKLEVK